MALAIVAGGFLGSSVGDGSLRAYSKIERLVEESEAKGRSVASEIRLDVYQVAWDVFQRSPWVGHGIGSFQSEFQKQRIIYAQDTGRALDAPRFSHPHNELLFWLVEGGVVAVGGILVAFIGLLWQIIKLGFQRGGALLAILFPLGLHTQLELHFYISTLHWLLLMFLLYILCLSGSQTSESRLSLSAARTITLASLIIPPLLSVFLSHSLLAQTGMLQFLKSKGTELNHLRYGRGNIYFREYANQFYMRHVLYSGIQADASNQVEAYVAWAEKFLTQIPEIRVYIDLAKAYSFLGRNDEALSTLEYAQSVYPLDESVSSALASLDLIVHSSLR